MRHGPKGSCLFRALAQDECPVTSFALGEPSQSLVQAVQNRGRRASRLAVATEACKNTVKVGDLRR
jgi:hypothetical protein